MTDNIMRQTYRELTPTEKAQMQAVKDKGAELYKVINDLGRSRELSLGMTRVEEAVMWAVKHITH